jgi:hypothetical protein
LAESGKKKTNNRPDHDGRAQGERMAEEQAIDTSERKKTYHQNAGKVGTAKEPRKR